MAARVPVLGGGEGGEVDEVGAALAVEAVLADTAELLVAPISRIRNRISSVSLIPLRINFGSV